MQTENFKNIELPAEKVLFQCIVGLRKADKDLLQKYEDLLFLATDKFMDAFKFTNEQEYREDPEILADDYLWLHSYIGCLLGLADGIHRKIKSEEFIEKMEIPEGKTKALAATDREYYARLAGVSIESLVTMLDHKQRTILERVNISQGKIRRR